MFRSGEAAFLGSAAARVWLVGEDPQVARVLGGMLSPAGHVCEAFDCAGAVARLAGGRSRIERVVVDACAQVSPLPLLQALQRAGVAVAMLVEAEDLSLIEAGMRCGVAAFVVKPVEPHSVLAALALPGGAQATPGSAFFPFRTLEDVAGLSQLVAGLCPDPQTVQIALSEIMVNAIEHGNLGFGFERKGELMTRGLWRQEVERLLDLPEHLSRFAFLRLECRPREVRFLVRDQGQGFEPAPYLNLNPARSVEPYGRGIAVARLLAFPDLVYLDGGRCVEGVVRRLNRHALGGLTEIGLS